MRTAMAELQGSAGRVARMASARPSAAGVDLGAEAVQQLEARDAFIASAKVVKTADAMLGTLLDTLA